MNRPLLVTHELEDLASTFKDSHTEKYIESLEQKIHTLETVMRAEQHLHRTYRDNIRTSLMGIQELHSAASDVLADYLHSLDLIDIDEEREDAAELADRLQRALRHVPPSAQ